MRKIVVLKRDFGGKIDKIQNTSLGSMYKFKV